MTPRTAPRIERKEEALYLNRLAREKMKLRLLADIRVDLAICEIEGWDKLEYVREIQEIINDIANGEEAKHRPDVFQQDG